MSYDPFARGPFPVGVRTVEARDRDRERLFPIEIWHPASARHAGQDADPATQDLFAVAPDAPPRRQSAVRDAEAAPGTYPLVVFAHASGHHRRGATFLCTHLASHGYVVAAMDHSEIVAPELARKDGETAQQRAARIAAIIASRVPDVRFLIDFLLDGAAWLSASLDPDRIGIVGHSFGGWTALAAPEREPRIRAVVALAPGGSSRPRPGIIPASLGFAWGRDVPTLYLVAENDICVPLEGQRELLARTPATRWMVILRRADHAHFMDHVEEEHEAARSLPWTGELAWMGEEMRPIAEFCSGEQAHLCARGLALSHLDARLRQRPEARRFVEGDVAGALAARGVAVIVAGDA